eukprot:4433405-Karenia_brevis.AAC.1
MKAMLHWKFPPRLVAAFIEESLELECSATLQGVDAGKPFPFTSAVKQGGVESTFMWNVVIRMLLDKLLDSWLDRQFGIELPRLGLVTHLVWADNLYFLGNSLQAVHTMMTEFTEILNEVSLFWKASSLELLHTSTLHIDNVSIHQHGHSLDVKVVLDMALLGTVLSSRSPQKAPVHHRFQKASAAFWKFGACLTAPELSATQRFQVFAKHVIPVVLYCAGGWVWSRQLYVTLLRWENAFLRRMLGGRRRPDEDF